MGSLTDKHLTVICNGPSLRGFNLERLLGTPTIGMCAAYREFKRINYWPDYYICMDYTVCNFHMSEYLKFMETTKVKQLICWQNSDPRFTQATRTNPSRFLPMYCNDQLPPQLRNDFYCTSMHNTGSAAAELGIVKGYKSIILLGADCNQVERIPESEPYGGNRLRIKETPKDNPNYWFGDYHIKGDIYSLPNHIIDHERSWVKLAKDSVKLGVKIYNCSNISTLDCFEKTLYDEAMNRIYADL